jgi:hypothetical protein
MIRERSLTLVLSTTLALIVGPLLGPGVTSAQQPKAKMKRKHAAKARAAAVGKPTCELLSVQVLKNPPPVAERGGDGTGPITTRFVSLGLSGTHLILMATLPGRHAIGVDPSATRLTRFTDDRGTDLTQFGGRRLGDQSAASLRPMPMFGDDDPSRLYLNVDSERTPAPGASRITLKADVVVLCAGGEKTVEQAKVPLKGGKITVGPVPMSVDPDPVDFGSAPAGDAPAGATSRVTLSADRPLDQIKGIAFIGPDGEAIDARLLGEGRGELLGKARYSRSYGLARKVAAATLRITYYEATPVVSSTGMATGVGF